jgi:hypothetical protein
VATRTAGERSVIFGPPLRQRLENQDGRAPGAPRIGDWATGRHGRHLPENGTPNRRLGNEHADRAPTPTGSHTKEIGRTMDVSGK